MPGQYGSFRSGWDAPSRITGTTVMLQGAEELLPGEPMYPDVIPFYPPQITSGDAAGSDSTTADGHKLWQRTPSRCDLLFYQGDDVVIPLYFNDPTIANDDMAAGYVWYAQVRTRHTYRSTFINQFLTSAEFVTGTTEDDEHTKVELFLPRTENVYFGVYRWDLYSIGPEDLARFPKPDDVDVADWPPIDALRTWLYGLCTIVPRVTSTDVLPTDASYTPQLPWPSPDVTVMTVGGWVVGPNGRVP